jgi:hypothetical protein
MCFNETASLVAFSIGILFCAILYFKRFPIFYVSFLFFITLIQLIEYFTHKSIKTHNLKLNELSTKLILITLFIQPIIYCYMSMYYPPIEKMRHTKLVSPLMLFYVLFFIFMFMYFDKNHVFKTTYLQKCESICRLKWFDFKGWSTLLGVVFVILYMALFLDITRDTKIKYVWAQYFALISLIIACIYVITLSNHGFSYIGSVWCFLAVFFGPLLLLTYKME